MYMYVYMVRAYQTAKYTMFACEFAKLILKKINAWFCCYMVGSVEPVP